MDGLLSPPTKAVSHYECGLLVGLYRPALAATDSPVRQSFPDIDRAKRAQRWVPVDRLAPVIGGGAAARVVAPNHQPPDLLGRITIQAAV